VTGGYTLLSEKRRVARKHHLCIWCGQAIAVGQHYLDERSIYDGQMQHHRWHPECCEAAHAGWANGEDAEFTPHENDRPPSAGDVEVDSWDSAVLLQGRLL